MRKTTLLKTLLVAVSMLLGANSVWGQTTSWTHGAGTYTGDQELSSNTAVISVKLGNSGTASWTRHGTYGVWIQNSDYRTPTFTNGLPTAGGYIVVKPTRTLKFSLVNWSAYNNCNLVMIESTNPGTKYPNFRQRRDNTNDFGTLVAGKTYYIYGESFNASPGATDYIGYKGFTATTYEDYTIHYKDGEGTTIKADVVHSGLYGASASASGSDLDPIEYEGETYSYKSGNTPITLSTGTNEITLVYASAPKHDYTVNAVAGITTLKELATGSAPETANYTVSNLPLVIKYNGDYYVLTDANASGYSKTFTMGTSDEVKSVEYTLDESIVYFAEGEDLYAAQTTASDVCSNGAYTYYLSGLTSTFPVANAGWYRMETVVMDRANKNPLNIYLEDDTELGTIAKGGDTGFRTTESFYVNASSNLKIGMTDPSNKNSLSFDYALVRKLVAPDGGSYYLKNKANGAYLGAGLNYGTKAISSAIGHVVKLNYNDRNYFINTTISNGGDNHYLNGVWCDGAATGWIFTSDGEGYYTISDGTNNLTAGVVGAELTLASGTSDNAKWQLLTEAEWKAENVARLDAATAANGVDATFYIPAANFSRNDNTENAKWQGSPKISGLSENSANTNYNAEKYNATFDVYQALTGLKPGAYKLTMQGYYRNGDEDDADPTVRNAILYANTTEKALVNVVSEGKAVADADHGFTTLKSGKYIPNSQIEASKAFNAGYYVNELYVVVDEDGALRVGVKKATAVTNDWTVFDNFQLTYYGNSVSTSIGAKGYTTFASQYPLDLSSLPSGLTAYYVEAEKIDKGNNVVRLTDVTEAVAAGTGLLLKGTENESYNIPVVALGTDLSETNRMIGCTTATEITTSTENYANFYVMVNGATAPEFQNIDTWVTGGNSVTIPAGKAYLNATGVGAARLSIVFDDEATGISDVRSKMEDVRGFYDLQGRRVAQPTKGLYIVNGKKVIKK